MRRRLAIALVLTSVVSALAYRLTPSAAECVGVKVQAGADLHTAVEDGVAQTYCLAAWTFQLGDVSLKPDDGDQLIGRPVTFGPKGEVYARTYLHGTSSLGVIEETHSESSLTLRNLDICCASDVIQTSSGVNGGFSKLVNLTVVASRIHGNGSTGITGVREGLSVSHSEIDHNGDQSSGGIDAGIKTVHFAIITSTYFHDNAYGMWWDCDAPGGVLRDNLITTSSRSGLSIEISSGEETPDRPLPPGGMAGFVVSGNTFDDNNRSNKGGHAGVLIDNSMNVDLGPNTVTHNGLLEILVKSNDPRHNGHDGCTSGFDYVDISVHDNSYGPAPLVGCDLPGVMCTHNTSPKIGGER